MNYFILENDQIVNQTIKNDQPKNAQNDIITSQKKKIHFRCSLALRPLFNAIKLPWLAFLRCFFK